MKRYIPLTLALALACGAAFAQGEPSVRITGQLQTGAQDVVTLGTGAAVDAVSLYDVDSGNPSRFRIGVLFTSADGNWGITTRLDSEGLSVPGFSAIWNRALVWGSILDRLLTLKAGLLDEETFSFTWKSWGAENIWGDQFDGNLGVEVQLRPLPGLTLGYVYPILNGTKALDALESGYIGAAYESDGIGRLVAGAQLSNAINSASAWLGAEITMVKDLTARVAAQAFYIGDTQFSWIQVYQELGYFFRDFGFGVKAWEEAYAATGSSLGWRVEPAVQYCLGLLTIGTVGDVGNLLLRDPNPGVTTLPFGWAAGVFAAFPLAPTSVIKAGCRYMIPDISAVSSTVQIFASFNWSF